MNYILLYICVTFCLSINLLMCLWVVTTFWLLCVKQFFHSPGNEYLNCFLLKVIGKKTAMDILIDFFVTEIKIYLFLLTHE